MPYIHTYIISYHPPDVFHIPSYIPGGHTSEMLKLTSRLSPEVYSPLCYVVASTDHTSADRIPKEGLRSGRCRVCTIPRSREVNTNWRTHTHVSTAVDVTIRLPSCTCGHDLYIWTRVQVSLGYHHGIENPISSGSMTKSRNVQQRSGVNPLVRPRAEFTRWFYKKDRSTERQLEYVCIEKLSQPPAGQQISQPRTRQTRRLQQYLTLPPLPTSTDHPITQFTDFFSSISR